MVVELVGTAVITADCFVLWRYTLPRYKERLARGDNDWRRQWRSLDPSKRRALTQAMRNGVAVHDPEDVDLVVRADAQLDHVRRASRVFEHMMVPIIAAVVAIAIADHFRFLWYVLGAGFLWWFVAGLIVRWQSRQRKRSVAASRQLHRV